MVTHCDAGGTQPRNRACAFKLADIDLDMDAYFSGCKAQPGDHSESDLPWENQRSCNQFSVSSIDLLRLL